jgi:hypothetical protein
MLRKILSAVVLGMALTLVTATFSLAAPTAPAGKPITKSGHDIINLSPADCAKAKHDYPSKANDPKICQLEHGWTETITLDSPTTSATGAQATGCPSGTTSFRDWIEAIAAFWQHDMDTGFKWWGQLRVSPTHTAKLLCRVGRQLDLLRPRLLQLPLLRLDLDQHGGGRYVLRLRLDWRSDNL